MSLGEALKSALFEKIEDEYDIALFQKTKKEFEDYPKTCNLSEIKEMYSL